MYEHVRCIGASVDGLYVDHDVFDRAQLAVDCKLHDVLMSEVGVICGKVTDIKVEDAVPVAGVGGVGLGFAVVERVMVVERFSPVVVFVC